MTARDDAMEEMRAALEWFGDRGAQIQSKFALHGPTDMDKALRAQFKRVNAILRRADEALASARPIERAAERNTSQFSAFLFEELDSLGICAVKGTPRDEQMQEYVAQGFLKLRCESPHGDRDYELMTPAFQLLASTQEKGEADG